MIIKEADKESAVVILDKTYNRTKIPKILNDEKKYRLLNANTDNKIIKITKFCRMHKKSLTKKEKDFLTD